MSTALSAILESSAGNLDLTPYLGVNEGEGLDPAAPAYTEKVYSQSLLRPGGILALEALHLREVVLPLKLKATSKDKLTALLRELNGIVNTPGCELAWSDEGTTTTTYFSLASGRCDPEFNFRMGQQAQPWLKAKLTLALQPLGRKEKTAHAIKSLAPATSSLVGSAPVLVFTPATPIGGDAPALIEAVLQPNSVGNEVPCALSVLPAASYAPWMPAASLTSHTGWVIGASQGFSYLIGKPSLAGFARASSHYSGDQRVLALAHKVNNTATPSQVTVTAYNSAGEPIEVLPSASVGNTTVEFNVVDCGVLHRSSLTALDNEWKLGFYSSATIALYGLVMLPENSTCWLINEAGRRTFNGLTEAITAGAHNVIGDARGPIPTLPPGTLPIAAFMWQEAVEKATVEVAVLEQTRYFF